jgi:hypothetical protein
VYSVPDTSPDMVMSAVLNSPWSLLRERQSRILTPLKIWTLGAFLRPIWPVVDLFGVLDLAQPLTSFYVLTRCVG